jgi:hypothetical protein
MWRNVPAAPGAIEEFAAPVYDALDLLFLTPALNRGSRELQPNVFCFGAVFSCR